MDIDRRILTVLRENPSATASELAARVYELEPAQDGRIIVPETKHQEIREALRRLLRLEAPVPKAKRNTTRAHSGRGHLRAVK